MCYIVAHVLEWKNKNFKKKIKNQTHTHTHIVVALLGQGLKTPIYDEGDNVGNPY